MTASTYAKITNYSGLTYWILTIALIILALYVLYLIFKKIGRPWLKGGLFLGVLPVSYSVWAIIYCQLVKSCGFGELTVLILLVIGTPIAFLIGALIGGIIGKIKSRTISQQAVG